MASSTVVMLMMLSKEDEHVGGQGFAFRSKGCEEGLLFFFVCRFLDCGPKIIIWCRWTKL